MPNSHRPPDTTRQCSLCRVRWCELSRSDRLTGAFCVAVRPAVAPVVLAPPPPTHSDAVGRLGRLNSHRHTRNNKMVLSMSCLMWRCELDDSSERVHTSKFLSVTVMSCRESSSHRRRGRVTDKTVLSCLAWRCELACMLCSVASMTRMGARHHVRQL